MSDELAHAEAAKREFIIAPSTSRIMPLIRKAYAAWDAMELGDDELADYLELIVKWLRHT